MRGCVYAYVSLHVCICACLLIDGKLTCLFSINAHTANFSIVGIIFGADWKELKKFARKGLSDFGAGKTPLEDCMKVEVDFLLAEVDATRGLPFDPKPLLSNAIANVMGSMIFGQR